MSEAKDSGQGEKVKPRISRLAVLSMALGILGFFSQCLHLISVLFSVTGFVLGIIALRKTAKSQGLLGGRGYAIAGLIISILGFSVPVLMAVTYINFFQQAQVVEIDDVSSKTTMILSHDGDPNKVDTIFLLVTGYIDGSATINIRDGGEDYPTHQIKGRVFLWIRGDWYAGKCSFEYEPIDVKSGSLTVRYYFFEIDQWY